MTRRLAPVAALALGVALVGVACIDGNIPARPALTVAPDGGGGDDADGGADDASDDAGVAMDGGLTVLASVSPCGGMKLVVSDGVLYWTEELTGQVKSVSTSGGSLPKMIADGQGSPGAIAVDSTYLFWVANQRRVVLRKPLAGGIATVFVHPSTDPERIGDENQINALLVASGTLFVGRFTYTRRYTTDVDEPVPTLLSDSGSELGRPGAFVLGDNHLYQVEIFHNAVTRETTDGNQKGLLEDGVTRQFYAPDQIAVMQSGLVTDAIGLIDDHVVWAVGPSIFRKSGNLLWGDPAQLVATTVGGGKVTGFVVSDGFVYFGEGNSDTIQVAAAYDGVPQVIATGQKSPTQFAADDHALYWRTYDCNIMKLAK